MPRIPIVVALFILLLAACGPAIPPPTLAPPPTAERIAVAPITPTAIETPTSIPTATASPIATATETPRPTDIPTATATNTPAAIATPKPTNTPTATPTNTPVPTFTLSGIVFFDYNGNGVRDSNEPGIAGATVKVGSLSATTAADGKYSLRGIPMGNQQVRLSAVGFRYVSLSLEAFQSSEQTVAIVVSRDTQRDLGLMQGFLTLPFGQGTVFTRPNSPFGFATVLDLDPRPGSAIAFLPDIEPVSPAAEAPWVVDQHTGLDFCIQEETEIKAAMPGEVTHVGQDAFCGLGFWICYGGFANYYNHNSKILVKKGERVKRGQVIALSGNTGQSGEPHLHFELTTCSTPPRYFDGGVAYDPFATENPNAPTKSLGYWTMKNSPQYP